MPDLYWEEYKEEDGSKSLFVSTDVEDAHVVAEGVLGQFVSDINDALESLHDAVQSDNPERVKGMLEPTYHIVRYELEKAIGVINSIPRKDLRPKHRDCRAVMKTALKRVSEMSPLREDGCFAPLPFIAETIKMLAAMHQCLLEETKKKDRVEKRNEYTGKKAKKPRKSQP